MAYADFENRARLNPYGLGGALFLSGGMVIAIALAAPNVMPNLDVYERLSTTVPTAPPIEKALPEKKQKEAPLPVLRAPPNTVPHLEADRFIPFTPEPVDMTKIVKPDPKPDFVKPDPKPEPKIEATLPPLAVPVRVVASVDPRFQAALQPPYPSSKRREEVGGRATVRVLIGIDGRVKAVESVRTDDPAFFEATRDQAFKKWRFRPATIDGKPVESWKTMSVMFKMENG
jgi:periplasmic protein TonB